MRSSSPFDTAFFERPAGEVARDLVGAALVRVRPDGTSARVLVVATEAFEDGAESATRSGMTYAPGQIFVMPMRGHRFLNVGTERAGTASCVMVSAVLAGRELVDGPGKVAKFLDVDDALDGRMLGAEILFSPSTINVDGKPLPATDRAKNSVGRVRVEPTWIAWLRKAPFHPGLLEGQLKPLFDKLCREIKRTRGASKESAFRRSVAACGWSQGELLLALDEFRDTGSLGPFAAL